MEPRVSDDFIKSFKGTSEESWWDSFDILGLASGAKLPRDVSGFKDGDGSRVFNAAVGSMVRTGKGDRIRSVRSRR